MSVTKEQFENRIKNNYIFVEHDIGKIPMGSYVIYRNPYLNIYSFGGVACYKTIDKWGQHIVLKNTINKKKGKVNSRGNMFYYKEKQKQKAVSFRTILKEILKEHSEKETTITEEYVEKKESIDKIVDTEINSKNLNS